MWRVYVKNWVTEIWLDEGWDSSAQIIDRSLLLLMIVHSNRHPLVPLLVQEKCRLGDACILVIPVSCLEDPIFWEEDQGHESNGRIDLVMMMCSLEDPILRVEGQGHESIGRIVCSGKVSVGCRQRIPIAEMSYPWVGSVYLNSCFSEDDRTLWLSSFLGKDYGRYGTGRWAWLRFWFKSEWQEVGFYPFSCSLRKMKKKSFHVQDKSRADCMSTLMCILNNVLLSAWGCDNNTEWRSVDGIGNRFNYCMFLIASEARLLRKCSIYEDLCRFQCNGTVEALHHTHGLLR